MRARAALVLALLSATAFVSLPPTKAGAKTDTRLRLDRAIAEPSVFPGLVRLRLFATAVTLQGGFIPLTGKKAFALKVGSSKKSTPYLMGAFAGTSEPLAIAIVVHTGFEYQDNWAEISAAFTPFLESLPKDSKVAIVAYSDSISATRFLTPKAATRKLSDISPESVPADNELIKSVERATRILDKLKTDPPTASARKFIILLSDGKDIDPEPKRFRKAGERAAKKGIRIHSVAFSPDDNRRPLLGLGELSKRSFGTFRWVRASGLFGAQFQALQAEVARQYVLTFFIAPKEIDGKRISLVADDAESNVLKVKIRCGEDKCSGDQYCHAGRCITRKTDSGTGIVGWILYIVFGLVGALLLLALIGYVLSKRQAAPMPVPGQMPPGPPGTAPDPAAVGGAPPPGPQTSNRIVAYDSQGNVLGGGGPPQAAHVARAAPTVGAQPQIMILTGPSAGRSIPVAHGATIGTHPSCQVHLPGDGFASGVHAQLLTDTAGNWFIVDKGSTNGTFVNGVRTQHHQQQSLAHGNSLKIGGAQLRFLVQ